MVQRLVCSSSTHGSQQTRIVIPDHERSNPLSVSPGDSSLGLRNVSQLPNRMGGGRKSRKYDRQGGRRPGEYASLLFSLVLDFTRETSQWGWLEIRTGLRGDCLHREGDIRPLEVLVSGENFACGSWSLRGENSKVRRRSNKFPNCDLYTRGRHAIVPTDSVYWSTIT